jgi:phosphoglucosamine mutase
VDGDELLTLFALYLQGRGGLTNDALAATVMSNLGLERALGSHLISVVRTDVGDRQIATALKEGSLALGGEQSGHIIIRQFGPTGDGLVSAGVLLHALDGWGGSLDLFRAKEVVRFPQVHRQVRTAARDHIMADQGFRELYQTLEADLGSDGRIVLRPSGTEPVFRILVEAADLVVAERLADRLVGEVELVARRLGAI